MEDISLKPNYLSSAVATELFEFLEEKTEWVDELTNTEGEIVKIHRKMAYVSDKPTRYNYAKLSFMGTGWNFPLQYLKIALEKDLEVSFNSVLLNRYKDGKDEIRWHSDKEASLGSNPVIACVNLGAPRKFWFRPIGPEQEKFFLQVNHGDLLVMGPECQSKFVHAILKETDVKEPRISLTYRYNFPEIGNA